MGLKEKLAESDASRNRPSEVVAILRRGIDYVAEKHAIPIDILSDATSEVMKKYRLWFAGG